MVPAQPQIRPHLKLNKPAVYDILHQLDCRLVSQHEALQFHARLAPRSKDPPSSSLDSAKHGKLPKPKPYWKKAWQWDADIVVVPSKKAALALKDDHVDFVAGGFDDAGTDMYRPAWRLGTLLTSLLAVNNAGSDAFMQETRHPVAQAASVDTIQPRREAKLGSNPHSRETESSRPPTAQHAPSTTAATPILDSREIEGAVDFGIPQVLSAHMFQQARDITISGGDFYNASGDINIDNSHSIHDASVHPTIVTLLYPHQHSPLIEVIVTLPIGMESECGADSDGAGPQEICSEVDCEDGSTKDANERLSVSPLGADMVGNDVLDSLYEVGVPEPIRHDEVLQVTEDCLSFSDADQGFHLCDDIIIDILSNYPVPPKGDFRSLDRIFKALLFAFTPLPPSTMAALLNLRNAQHVRRILAPVHPLIFMPSSDKDNEKIPLRIIHPTVVDFFLDRTRSGKYFISGSGAHRVLLEGTTQLMRRIHEDGYHLDIGSGWQEAYNYACTFWEAHRRAANRSKL
ncbi:hypothetical protein CVT26_003399 [Gymnopilus dilepis]|uniref:Uncharacterized protein n=1 Tax=Gymnopilus dilepis TaxID=231916 RepID=A0A409Y5C4_9AGAR|nr:hypothetical protein CVT26_003399 [Gymnopilus dilepis]